MSAARPYYGRPLEPARAAALGRLHHHIGRALEEDGADIPCLSADRDKWIAEDRATQREAADRCLDACPVFVACLEYRRAWPEPGCVMGGELPSPKTGRTNR